VASGMPIAQSRQTLRRSCNSSTTSGDDNASKHTHTTPAAANHLHDQHKTRKSLAKAGFRLIHNGFRPNKISSSKERHK